MYSLKLHEKAMLLENNMGIHFDMIKGRHAIAKDDKGYFLAVLDKDFQIITRHYSDRDKVIKTFDRLLQTGTFEVHLLEKGLKVKKKKQFKPFIMDKEAYDNWFLY